jgi:hypothetical protein
MRSLSKCVARICVPILSILALFALDTPAVAGVLEQVEVREKDDGFQIRISLAAPMSYQRHSPQGAARDFIVELRPQPVGQAIDVSSIQSRDQLGFGKSSVAPIQEVVYDGADGGRPTITLHLTRAAAISVSNGRDLKTLVVDIMPVGVAQPLVPRTAYDDTVAAAQIDVKLGPVMKEARQAMVDGKFDRAVQLFTKIVESGEGPLRRDALELLGLARERNGQLAQAKAEYDRYLNDYPDGADADRVRQRLAALVTLDSKPATGRSQVAKQTKGAGKWRTEADGSLAQYYYRNTVHPPGGPTQTTQSSLTTDLDVRARARTDTFDMRALFVGSYDADLLTGGADVKRLYNASVEVRDLDHGLFGKIGRQSQSSAGVFGRFDGVRLSADLLRHLRVNALFGYPVESSRVTNIDTSRKLYGAGFDFDNLVGAWSLGTYFIQQTNSGLTDRRAVGAEVKYFEPGRSLYALIDYDIFFNELSTAYVIGSLSFGPSTTINASLDYRRGPFLTTENAIIGQGVTSLSDLLGLFTPNEIYQFAVDRTATSRTGTVGITQILTDQLQLNSDLSISSLSGTTGSGGVPGFAATGTNIYWSTQLVATDFFRQGATFIGGLRYASLDRYDGYGVTLNYRIPVTQAFRINPRLFVDYRVGQGNVADRLLVRPWIRMDYRVSRWLQFEFEGGVEWYDEMLAALPSARTTGTFFYGGYRILF